MRIFSSPDEDARTEALVKDALVNIRDFLEKLPLGSAQEFDAYLRDTLRLNFLFMKYAVTKKDYIHCEENFATEFCRHIYTHLYHLGKDYAPHLEVFFALHSLLFYVVIRRLPSDIPSSYPRAITLEDWFSDGRADLISLHLRGKCTTRLQDDGDIKNVHIGCANAEIIDLLSNFCWRFTQFDLMCAVKNKNVYAVRRLLEQGALKNWTIAPVFSTQEAFTCGNIEIMRLFMMFGGNPHEKSYDGKTSLLSFVEMNEGSEENEECVRELLGYGVDPDIPDMWGTYPLDVMIEGGYSKECCDLVRKGMKPRE